MDARQIALGIDIGGTRVKIGIVNKDGQLLDKISIPTGQLEPFWTQLSKRCEELLGRHQLGWFQVMGVGIGVPGLIDAHTGHLYMAPNLKWYDVNVHSQAKEVFPVPVQVENDANMAALAESWLGTGRGLDSFVMLTIGTGVGSGLIIGGRIYKGTGVASELGHMVLEKDGPPCCCGSRGCLETFASGPAMLNYMEQLQAETGSKAIKTTTVKELFNQADTGNALAAQTIERAATYLGIGVANIINALCPQVIALGGGVSKGGERLMQPMLAEVAVRALAAPLKKVKIVPAHLQNDAGMIGGGGLFWLGGER